jgi:hypothetical protein
MTTEKQLTTLSPEQQAGELLQARQSRETDINTLKSEIAAAEKERENLVNKPGDDTELVTRIDELDQKKRRAKIRLERLESQHRVRCLIDVDKAVELEPQLKALDQERKQAARDEHLKQCDEWLSDPKTAAAVRHLMRGYYLGVPFSTGNTFNKTETASAEAVEEFCEKIFTEDLFEDERFEAQDDAASLAIEPQPVQHLAAIKRLAAQAPEQPATRPDDFRVSKQDALKASEKHRYQTGETPVRHVPVSHVQNNGPD